MCLDILPKILSAFKILKPDMYFKTLYMEITKIIVAYFLKIWHYE